MGEGEEDGDRGNSFGDKECRIVVYREAVL